MKGLRMEKRKKLSKMPQIEGHIPAFYNRDVIYIMGTTINTLAAAIDFLAQRVEELEAKVQKEEKE